MKLLLYLGVPTLLLISNAYASPLLPKPLHPRAPNSNPKLHCYGTNSVLFAPTPDCATALSTLRSDSSNATFHDGAPIDGHALFGTTPQTGVQNCGIYVNMVLSHTQDVSSWKEIKEGAQAVFDTCSAVKEGNTGGYVYVGKEGRILVQVRGLKRAVGGLEPTVVIPAYGTDGAGGDWAQDQYSEIGK